MMVVAVPMKNTRAFSSPAFEGWSFVPLEGGSDSGRRFPSGWSRVGGRVSVGSSTRRLVMAIVEEKSIEMVTF